MRRGFRLARRRRSLRTATEARHCGRASALLKGHVSDLIACAVAGRLAEPAVTLELVCHDAKARPLNRLDGPMVNDAGASSEADFTMPPERRRARTLHGHAAN